jgi:hypothetical protein
MQLRTPVKVTRTLSKHSLMLPRCNGFGDNCWKQPTSAALRQIFKNPDFVGDFVYRRSFQRPSATPG